MIAVVYILVVLLPLMKPRPQSGTCRATSWRRRCSTPCPCRRWRRPSAVGWLLAYLGGPDIVRGWIEAVAGDKPHRDHVHDGGRADHRGATSSTACPAIAIFMPIIVALTQLAHIKPGAHGRAHHREPGLRADHTPPLRPNLATGRGRSPGCRSRALLRQSVPLYGIFFLVINPDHPLPRRRCSGCPGWSFPQSVGCFPKPGRRRLHLPAQLDDMDSRPGPGRGSHWERRSCFGLSAPAAKLLGRYRRPVAAGRTAISGIGRGPRPLSSSPRSSWAGATSEATPRATGSSLASRRRSRWVASSAPCCSCMASRPGPRSSPRCS